MAAQRLLAGLYLSMPHDGLIRGGRFLRGESGQGVSKQMKDNDEREAVARLERARDVAAHLAAVQPPGASEAERQEIAQAWIGVDFDLTTALTQVAASGSFNHYLDQWLGIRPPPGGSEPDDRKPGSAYPDPSDYDPREPHSGIPPRPDGAPWFAALPASTRRRANWSCRRSKNY